MSIVTIGTPAVEHSTTNISKWSAVHNEVCYRFRRQDYSVLGGTAGSGGLLRLQLLIDQTDDLSIGDTLYLSSIDRTVIVSQITDAFPFRFVDVDVMLAAYPAGSGAGWANNHTARKNFFIEANIHVFNYQTSLNEIAGTVRLYPNKQGVAKLIIGPWLEKFLTRKNLFGYASQYYNDKEAWVKFYFSHRSVWRGYESESFYEDRVNPYLGANIVTNSTFLTANGSSGWDLTNMLWRTSEDVEKKHGNILEVLLPGVLKPEASLLPTYPTVAGTTYRIKFKILDAKTTGHAVGTTINFRFGLGTAGTSVNEIVGLNGIYQFDMVAPFNNSYPQFDTDSGYWGAMDNISVQELFSDELTNPPRYYYVNKAARQLQNVYGSNQAEHVTFYDTIADAAKRAKFISDFVQPTWFAGYPFDIAILLDESLKNVEITRKEDLRDINSSSTSINSTVLTPAIDTGEHRLMLTGGFASTVKSLDLWLEVGAAGDELYVDDEYVDDDYVEAIEGPSAESGEVTERRRIRINQSCFDNHVYLAWKGVYGGWNYYLFTRQQTYGVEIKNAQVAFPYVPDLNVEENKFLMSNDSEPFITLGANNIDRNDVTGLMRMLESERVTMYMGLDSNNAPIWQTVIVKTGSFKVYDSKDKRHDIEFTIEQPSRYTHRA